MIYLVWQETSNLQLLALYIAEHFANLISSQKKHLVCPCLLYRDNLYSSFWIKYTICKENIKTSIVHIHFVVIFFDWFSFPSTFPEFQQYPSYALDISHDLPFPLEWHKKLFISMQTLQIESLISYLLKITDFVQ